MWYKVISCCQDTGEWEVKLWVLEMDCRVWFTAEREERPKRGREEGRRGPVEMRVAAPFFTADKNICWDINLKLRSSLPLLPHHPSSFRTNHHLGTPPPSPLPRATTHTHAPLPPVFLPHSWPHIQQHFLQPQAITQNIHARTNTHGCNAMPVSNRT